MIYSVRSGCSKSSSCSSNLARFAFSLNGNSANNLSTASDRELVERFNSGERAAFDELVDRYSSRAYQIAYGVLGNREDAEEVAQDVFVRVYRALGKFRGDSEFTTWMYRIAVNLAKNKYRWNKTRGGQRTISIDAPRPGREDDQPGIDPPETRIGPDERIAVEELRDNVSMAYYEAGHMMYIHMPSLADIKRDLAEFIQSAMPS